MERPGDQDGDGTAGDLAEHAHVTTGAVTGILNRLERAGFITRVPDPTDRRRVRVASVPAAVSTLAQGYIEELRARDREKDGE